MAEDESSEVEFRGFTPPGNETGDDPDAKRDDIDKELEVELNTLRRQVEQRAEKRAEIERLRNLLKQPAMWTTNPLLDQQCSGHEKPTQPIPEYMNLESMYRPNTINNMPTFTSSTTTYAKREITKLSEMIPEDVVQREVDRYERKYRAQVQFAKSITVRYPQKGVTAREFLRTIESRFAHLDMDKDLYKIWIPVLLQGHALKWYDANAKYLRGWDHFCLKFLEQVGTRTDEEVLGQLRMSRQTRDVKALEYIQSMEEKFSELISTPPESEQINIIIKGMQRQWVDYLCDKRIWTYTDLRTWVNTRQNFMDANEHIFNYHEGKLLKSAANDKKKKSELPRVNAVQESESGNDADQMKKQFLSFMEEFLETKKNNIEKWKNDRSNNNKKDDNSKQNGNGSSYPKNNNYSSGNAIKNSSKGFRCYNCEGLGHMLRECPSKRKPRNDAPKNQKSDEIKEEPVKVNEAKEASVASGESSKN